MLEKPLKRILKLIILQLDMNEREFEIKLGFQRARPLLYLGSLNQRFEGF